MASDPVALLEKLIAFPTVSSDSNRDLIQWVADYLERFGIASRLTWDDAGTKANLFATIGNGPDGIILSGHTDVVPVMGQAWSTDPFQAVSREGRIFGRGSCDMKGFIAVALSLVPDLVARASGRAVHLALSYDEEVGCLGARRMLADIPPLPSQPLGCIVGEPTMMRVIVGHKGAGMYAFTVTGRAAHSSLAPQGVNAILHSTRIIERLRSIATRLESSETRHEGYDVPYSTVQVNRISGGTAGNIVADHCEFLVDIRSLPHTSQAALLAEIDTFIAGDVLPDMRAVAPEAAVTWEQVGDVPGFSIDEDCAFVREVKRALQSNEPGSYVAFGTEAGLFQREGIPTLVCGPGSIEQAHRPDEFVALAQLEQCERMLRALLF